MTDENYRGYYSNHTDENSPFNRDLLTNINAGQSDGYYKVAIGYCKRNKLFNIMNAAFDKLHLPSELTLQEKIVYYDMFVKDTIK